MVASYCTQQHTEKVDLHVESCPECHQVGRGERRKLSSFQTRPKMDKNDKSTFLVMGWGKTRQLLDKTQNRRK